MALPRQDQELSAEINKLQLDQRTTASAVQGKERELGKTQVKRRGTAVSLFLKRLCVPLPLPPLCGRNANQRTPQREGRLH